MQSLEGWLSLYFYRYIQNIQKRRETKQGSDKILRSWIITLQDLYDVVKLLWFGDTWKDINGGQQEGSCASSDSFFKYPLMLAIQAESDDRKTASQNFFRDQVLCSWTSDESTKSTKTSWAPCSFQCFLALRKVQIEQGLVISGALCLFVLQYTNLYKRERERLIESAGLASYL